jgi:hypothetical protein
MWNAHEVELHNSNGLLFNINLDSRAATFANVLRAWQDDAALRAFFNALLADAPYAAFRWETPPVTAATLSRPFEFVLLDSPELARHPDPNVFAKHFAKDKADVVAFPNLGGDAVLIVPRPVAEPSAYGHLAAFVRHAPEAQRHALWRLVGETLTLRVGDKSVWLSTAGAGVAWLHVRLDDRPKYYRYGPYRRGY